MPQDLQYQVSLHPSAPDEPDFNQWLQDSGITKQPTSVPDCYNFTGSFLALSTMIHDYWGDSRLCSLITLVEEPETTAAKNQFSSRVDYLRKNYTLGELITALAENGTGNSEELDSYLVAVVGLHEYESYSLIELLTKAAGFYSYPEGGIE